MTSRSENITIFGKINGACAQNANDEAE